jgi:SAM-dependent methyltransferase
MTASASSGPLSARVVRRVAFGLAAGVYDLLTDHSPWRGDCRDMARLVPGRRILDLGVGPGLSALEMARASPASRLTGLDVSAAMLRRAQAHAAAEGVALRLVRGDALRLPFRGGAFDGAVGHSVLYLLPDADQALAELRRTVRPGGRVAFLEPRAGSLPVAPAFAAGLRPGLSMALWRGMSRLHRRWSEVELSALLAARGFCEVRAWPVLGGLGVMASALRG